MTITGNQIRAARALIGWEQTELSEASGISINTIRKMEKRAEKILAVRLDTLMHVRSAFKKAGVILLEDGEVHPGGRGVRLIASDPD